MRKNPMHRAPDNHRSEICLSWADHLSVYYAATIIEAGYCNRKAKYGGMEDFDTKKLKDHEDENRRLKPVLPI